MPTLAPKQIVLRASQDAGAKPEWRAFVANPLPLRVELPAGVTLNGAIELRAELHDQRQVMGRTPLAAVPVAFPTGGVIDLEFTAEQMNQPLGGMSEAPFWLLLRGLLPGQKPLVLDLGVIRLVSHPASDITPEPPEPNLIPSGPVIEAAILKAEQALTVSGNADTTAAAANATAGEAQTTAAAANATAGAAQATAAAANATAGAANTTASAANTTAAAANATAGAANTTAAAANTTAIAAQTAAAAAASNAASAASNAAAAAQVAAAARNALAASAAALDARMEAVKEAAGNSTATLEEYLVFQDTDGNPVNVYQNTICTVPATAIGDPVRGLKSPTSAHPWRLTSATPPTLQQDSEGRWCVRIAAAVFTRDYPSHIVYGVSGMWAVARKNSVAYKNALVGASAYTHGLFDTPYAGHGYGYFWANGASTPSSGGAIANDESLDPDVPRLHTGYHYDKWLHYAVNGRQYKAIASTGAVQDVDVIGYSTHNPNLSYDGDIYAIALATGRMLPAFVDEVNARLGKLLSLPITSLLRRLVVCSGNSIIELNGSTTVLGDTPNTAAPDQLQRILGDRFRVESTAVAGWDWSHLNASNFEAHYDRWQPKICLILEHTNFLLYSAAGHTVADSLARNRTFYLAKKALGYQVFQFTVPNRKDFGGGGAHVSLAEHQTRIAAVNAALRDASAIGYYHDKLIDIVSLDARWTDPDNTTLFFDKCHPTVEGARIIAQAAADSILQYIYQAQ